jgi:serine/threonine protein kinase
LLSSADRAWIRREGVTALCPILLAARDDGGAVIALKARRNALRLSPADMQFLTAISGAAMLALASIQRTAAERQSGRVEEELALQCDVCGRVEAWRSDHHPCACGGRTQPAALPAVVGESVRLDRLLGKGGMGVVYEGTDLVLKRRVAVKTIPRLSADSAEQLLKEAESMAALPHPHIAVLYSVSRWHGTPVLVVEHLAGGTLATRLLGGPLPETVAFDLGVALAGALVYMHAAERYHGDIKPRNVGFTVTGVPKYLDFGLSRGLARTDEERGQPAGTLPYLAPEVLDGAQLGATSDVWALSVVVFEMVTGCHPFLHPTDTVARIKSGCTEAAALASGASLIAADCFSRLLSPRQEDRPIDAADLQNRLHRVRTTLSARFPG